MARLTVFSPEGVFRRRLAPVVGALVLLLLVAAPTQAVPVTDQLSYWVKADEGALDPNFDGVIDEWQDLSGGGHHAFSGGSPFLVSDALNGRPAIRFGDGDYFDILGSPLTSQEFTIIAVASDIGGHGTGALGGGYREIISNWTWGTHYHSVYFGTADGGPRRVRFTDLVGDAGSISDPSQPFILAGVSTFADSSFYLDGALLSQGPSVAGSRDFSTPWVIGKQGSIDVEFGHAYGEWWEGDIAEILVYDKALSSGELAAVHGYLNDRYFTVGVPESASVGFFVVLLACLFLGNRRQGSFVVQLCLSSEQFTR